MELRVNLKVCEGCGCLWYRAQVDTGVYCSTCHLRFKDFPTPITRKRRGRPKKTVLPTVFAVASPSWNSTSRATPYLDPEMCMREGAPGLASETWDSPVSASSSTRPGNRTEPRQRTSFAFLGSKVATATVQLGGVR